MEAQAASAFNPADILTPAELSARLKVSEYWPYEQMRPSARRRPNPLPAMKVGGLLRFHWPTVCEWLKTCTPSESKPARRRKLGRKAA